MRYYCEACGAEATIPPRCGSLYPDCPNDSLHGAMARLPLHETVAEWEKRHRESYDIEAPVYQGLPIDSDGEFVWVWSLAPYGQVSASDKGTLVVATEAGRPSRGWFPTVN